MVAVGRLILPAAAFRRHGTGIAVRPAPAHSRRQPGLAAPQWHGYLVTMPKYPYYPAHPGRGAVEKRDTGDGQRISVTWMNETPPGNSSQQEKIQTDCNTQWHGYLPL